MILMNTEIHQRSNLMELINYEIVLISDRRVSFDAFRDHFGVIDFIQKKCNIRENLLMDSIALKSIGY